MNTLDLAVITRFFKKTMFIGFAFSSLGVTSLEVAAQESGIGGFSLNRLFRLGGSSAEKSDDHQHHHDDDRDTEVIARGTSPKSFNANGAESLPGGSAAFQPAVSSPGFGQSNAARITARPNQTGPVTEADPILTRVGIGRADSGSTFGLFLQVYADGTVIDSEGVHHLPVSQIRQVLNVIRGHDFSRIKGHCGQPSADYVENVQMIVYDRSLGRLRAHAFSYSGNPNGCDDSVMHLHKAVEDLVLQIAGGKPGENISQVGPTTIIPEEAQVVGSGSTVGLSPVVESPNAQPVTTYGSAASSSNYQQGAVVPRIPAPTTPPISASGGSVLPSLTAPR